MHQAKVEALICLRQAFRIYKLAASWGDAAAMGNVGSMYANGRGVRLDYSEANKYFLMAANRGDVEAMKVIAAAYQEGVGVKKNLEEAMKWLNKAKQYEGK